MAIFDFFRRTDLSDRQEAAVIKTLQSLRSQRRNRFRILACIDGSEEAMNSVRFAARLSVTSNCDIIILYVRPIDMGLHSGGLQVRLARQKSVLDLLAYLSREKPAADVATRRSRQMLGSLFGAPAGALDAPLAASSGDGDRLTVQLLALSTPEQKRNAIRRLTGYREDFSLLAAR